MIDKTLDIEILSQWIGKSESQQDTIRPQQARLMQSSLDQNPCLTDGDALPPLWHWIYFLKGGQLSSLGRDGHSALGGFLPPVALPRRMWAGGRLEFKKNIVLGETLNKVSKVKSISMKRGRSGQLCFVTVQHTYTGEDGETRLIEEQDIVYRENARTNTPASNTNAPARAAPDAPERSVYFQKIVPSTVQLFRYSALTFNSHRIHYDRDYCKEIEGYPGLVFHGPLVATLLAGLAAKNKQQELKSFEYRSVSPLFDNAPFTLHTDGEALVWAQNQEGRLAMKATAS